MNNMDNRTNNEDIANKMNNMDNRTNNEDIVNIRTIPMNNMDNRTNNEDIDVVYGKMINNDITNIRTKDETNEIYNKIDNPYINMSNKCIVDTEITNNNTDIEITNNNTEIEITNNDKFNASNKTIVKNQDRINNISVIVNNKDAGNINYSINKSQNNSNDFVKSKNKSNKKPELSGELNKSLHPKILNYSNPTIIGLAGSSGVGKSTLAKHLVSLGYTKYAFAEPLKKGIQCMFGLTDDQVYTQKGKELIDDFWGTTPREILQYVGTEFFRNGISKLLKNIDSNFWIKAFEKVYDQKQKNEYGEKIKYVIDDVRFINEVEFIKSKGGIVFHITRPTISYSEEQSNNSSNENEKNCYVNDTNSPKYNDITYSKKTSSKMENDKLLQNIKNVDAENPSIFGKFPNFHKENTVKSPKNIHISETELCSYKYFDGDIVNNNDVNSAIAKLDNLLNKRISKGRDINGKICI
jgi:hypothetical protein